MVKLAGTVGESIKGNPLDEILKVRDSKDTVLDNFRLMLVGPPKEGKTFTGFTASEFYPDKLPAAEMTDLKDLFWCALDSGALDGAKEQNLSIPHMDLSKVPGAYIQQAMRAFAEEARKRVEAGITKTVVYDSLTSLDKLLLARLMKDYEKWGLYQAVLAEHLSVFEMARALNCNVIFICHGKAVMASEDSSMQTKQIAAGITPGTIEMDLSGQIGNFYRGAMSLIMPVACKGSHGNETYHIYPHGAKGFVGYSRFASLEKEEPANLRQLFAKIRGNQSR